MLIPIEQLKLLPSDTLENLIRTFLTSNLEDIGFDELDSAKIEQAISQCQQQLFQGELVVNFSELDETFAICRKEDLPFIGEL